MFPHLSQPHAHSVQVWLWKVFSQKLTAGLRLFSFEIHEILRKWGKTFRGQQSPSIWKIEIPDMPLHPSAYSLPNCVKKIVICYDGDSENVPPFDPRQLFVKFGALALPKFLSDKSEKNHEGEDQSCAWAYQVSLPYIKPFLFSETL